MTEPPSDATSGDASSAGLRTIFDDVPIMTSSFMQLGSSEAMSGFLPMTTNAFSSMEGMHGLSGPPYSALNRRSTDHSQFGVDSDDLTGTDKALKKKKALQEKSKRAQRRYRERKKAEAEELKKQIEELSSRLSTLTAEKNQLQNRNSLLEKVVQVRGGGGNASVSAQALDMPGNNVHDYVAASATFLGLVYPGRGLEHSIRKEHMDNMTSEDYRKVWRDYINKLTHLLLAAEGDAGGAALEQIRELVESQRWAVQCYGKSDMSKLMKISLDVRREGSPRFTSVDAARKLMARLGLTMDQKFRIAAVRRQFVARLQGIQRGRAMAAAALQSPVPERFDDVSALQSFSEDSIVQEGHMQALIREQQEAFALAQYGIREILTPVQDARLLVDAFPQPPDPMLLSRLVAEELHDPSAQFAIESVPSAGPGRLRPLLAPALDSTEFPPLPGDFFEPPPDHNNAGMPPAHTVTTGFI